MVGIDRDGGGMNADGDRDGLPLADVTIVDLLDGAMAGLTRILAGLGANVVRLAAAGHRPLDPARPTDHDALRALFTRAQLVVVGHPRPAGFETLEQWLPGGVIGDKVVLTASMFGTGNAFSDWQATDGVLHALSSELSRSGLAGRAPLLPPGQIALECALAQGAYVAMAALVDARRTGRGSTVDFSALDGAVQALDPGFGLAGSATLGRSARALPPGRPPVGTLYPIFACADGAVRLCLLAPRQWRTMWRWMGEPAAFAGPEYDSIATRQACPELARALAEFLAPQSREALEGEAMARGVPLSGLWSMDECRRSAHVRGQAGGLVDFGTVSAGRGRPFPPARPGAAPLAGLRVLDLGVIVVGGEQGRLLADLGADVVKVEAAAFPDGTRHTYLPTGLSVGFAAGHRNKRSLGLDLRHPQGRELFLALVAEADVVLSNFKPGTTAALGFDDEALLAINPAVVLVESSAFGREGPWAPRMGYGPLVRAAAGLTGQWRYPDDPASYSDTVTIYPDHVAARIGTIATLALLWRRMATGAGGTASIAQLGVILDHFSHSPALPEPADAPWGVFRARGEDEWCVVTVRDGRDFAALARAIGRADWAGEPALALADGRTARRAELEQGLAAWMAGQDADAAMALLQRAGVPAARMLRIADLPEFPYFAERGLLRVEHHPHLAEEVIAERFHAKSARLTVPPSRPAPLMGEHSAEIMREWLGLAPERIAALLDAGVLQPVDPKIAAMLARGEGRGQPNPGVPEKPVDRKGLPQLAEERPV